MSDPIEVPSVPPYIQMHTQECLPSPPEGFQPFEPARQSLPELDIPKLIAGGRSVVVVPYDRDVCSGGRGTFQIVSGMGGQVCNAIFLGNTVGRRQTTTGLPAHGVGLQADADTPYEPDVVRRDPDIPGGPAGDRCVAVRDRGQWYVVRMGESGVDGAPPSYYPATVQTVLDGQPTHWTTPEGPDDWTAIDLPVSYAHGEDFPNEDQLPDGVGWVRLRQPSMILDGRSGEAGNTELTFGEQENVLEGGAATLVRGSINTSTLSVRMWFSHNVSRVFTDPAPDAWSDYVRLTVRNTLTDLPVIGSDIVAGQPNALDLTMDGLAPAVVEEAFNNGVVLSLLVHDDSAHTFDSFVQTAGTFTYPVGASGFLLFFNEDRAAYVLVANRVNDEDIVVQAAVEVSDKHYLLLADQQQPANIRRVYDIILGNNPASESAGPVPIEVLGGQYWNDDPELPCMIYAPVENKIPEAPAGWVNGQITFTAVAGVVTASDITETGSWIDDDEAGTATLTGIGDGNAVISITITDGEVVGVIITDGGTGYPDEFVWEIGAAGDPQTLPFPEGYGYGQTLAAPIGRFLISYWGDKNTIPQWPVPAGRYMLLDGTFLATATSGFTFQTRKVISR